ncbi:hypothetical protein D3C83_249140 [compost metagenome]
MQQGTVGLLKRKIGSFLAQPDLFVCHHFFQLTDDIVHAALQMHRFVAKKLLVFDP